MFSKSNIFPDLKSQEEIDEESNYGRRRLKVILAGLAILGALAVADAFLWTMLNP